MKRSFLMGLAFLGAACQIPSGLTTPTTSATITPTSYYNAAGAACPTPTPTATPSLPFATFGHAQTVQGAPPTCPTNLPPDVISPVYSVFPTSGTAPLTSTFSMCGSSDADPDITLRYTVDYGDGSTPDGSQQFCKFQHTFTNPGTYQTNLCVWDEIPAHLPGICKTVPVAVATPCTITSFTNVCNSFGEVSVTVTLSGVGSCGEPLTLSASGGGQNFTSTQTCPPGSESEGCSFNFFPFTIPSGPGGPTVTVTGQNAKGSIVIPYGTNPDACG